MLVIYEGKGCTAVLERMSEREYEYRAAVEIYVMYVARDRADALDWLDWAGYKQKRENGKRVYNEFIRR